MLMQGDGLALEASLHANACSELRDLAASVILQALYDLTCDQTRARESAARFIRREGGGIWADHLGIDRDAIRRAGALRRAQGGKRNAGIKTLLAALAAEGSPDVTRLRELGVPRTPAYRLAGRSKVPA